MNRVVPGVLGACLLLTACATSSPQTAPEPVAPTDLSTLEEFPTFQGARLSPAEGEAFVGARNCVTCHTSHVDESGADVSIDAFWRASTMANAARDPYWQASVRAESLASPHVQSVIEDKCATCHMPMARTDDAAAGGQGVVLDAGYLNAGHPRHDLAMEGVSCTLCHQIEPAGFGEAESFSGHYTVDTSRAPEERLIYGPFPVLPDLSAVMQASSGFAPSQSTHIQQSEQCATCHTLYTPYLDAGGEVAGQFPEQMVYFEWLNSDYAQSQSCQGCHMPQAEGAVTLSITGGPAREPFHQHAFAGSNAYLLTLFRASGESGATASSQQFDAALERTLAMLQSQTAELAVEHVQVAEGQLTAEIAITSLTGHKFPTGFPSRRAWLHIAVQDAAGEIVFESGAVANDGSITGNDHDEDAAAFEPHHDVIASPDDVQIYETIMGSTEGAPTTTLLLGARYLKDNRLLPAGFDLSASGPDTAVFGEAALDPDFLGGGDRVRLAVDLGEARGPFTLTVHLYYQSIGYRWAQNLGNFDGAEIAVFLDLYAQAPNLPVLVAAAAEVQP